MKIRAGFVSNSSSSSFVMCIDNDLYDKMYEGFDETEKKIVDFLSIKKRNFTTFSILDGEDFYEDDFEDLKDVIKYDKEDEWDFSAKMREALHKIKMTLERTAKTNNLDEDLYTKVRFEF